MNRDVILRILTFVVLSYVIAFALDIAVLWFGLPGVLWGFSRMWSVTLSAVICLVFFGDGFSASFRKFLGFSGRVAVLYLLAPAIVYCAFGLYVILALPAGLFDFGACIKVIADSLRGLLTSASEEQITSIATTTAYLQIIIGYFNAVTANALYALGEEIGWRGYLFSLLGFETSLKNVLIVGVLWGLWHAPATILLGFNYSVNRYLGVLLFTLFTTALTYPHLLITKVAGSVLPAASLHGAVNALWGFTVIASSLPKEQKEIFLGIGVLGIVTWVILSLVIHSVRKILMRRGEASST